jgi:hypothetical protein
MNGHYLKHAIATAFRVARFETAAIADFDQSFEGFYRSFFAAIVCLPLYVFVVLGERRLTYDIANSAPGSAFVPLPPPDLGFAAWQGAAYVLNWLTLPIALIALAPLLGVGKRYVSYIVAYNWGTCVVLAATLIPYAVYLSGFASFTAVFIVYYGVSLFVLTYRWRLARYGLGIPAITAAGIVILDVLFTVLIALGTAKLRGGFS